MSSGQCSCPDCGTILRIRDRSFVGRTIDCPECHADLLIEIDEHRVFSARRAPTEQKPRSTPQLAVAASRVHVALVQRLASAAKSPLMLAWALGIGLTAFFAIVMLRPAVRFQPKPAPSSQESVTTETDRGPAEIEKGPPSVPEPVAPDLTLPPDATLTEKENPTPVEPSAGNTPQPNSVAPLATTAEPPVATAPSPTPVVTPPKSQAPPPVKIDMEPKLKQPLVAYKQTRSILQVIETVEAMLGVPIEYDVDELGKKNLDKSVTIELENTTVGGVLKAVLDGAGWDFVIEDYGLRLKPRRVAGPATP